MDNIQLAELLDRYIKGTCTPEEIAIINTWYNKYQNTPGLTETLSPIQNQLLKDKISQKIQEHITGKEIGDIKPHKPVLRQLWVKIAAAAIVIVLIKMAFFNGGVHTSDQIQSANNEIRLINRTKNIVKQVLPDSSMVWLSPNSRITYATKFRGKTRDVLMNGECFFEVSKDAAHPFIVTSNHMITKVWGTSFRVRDAGTSASASVTVVTGKVSVTKKSIVANAKATPKEVMLHPKEAVVYKEQADDFHTELNADMTSLDIWKRINVSFDNAKLSEIVTVLNKKFNANIRVDDVRLNDAVMDADLTGLNLPDVLEVLKASLRLNYELRDNAILLTPSKTNKPN